MSENLEKLLRVLKASEADAWEVTETREKGWEFYLIRHALDQNRVKELTSFQVKVYRKTEEIMGSAGAPIPPDATETAMARRIAELCQEATYVRNPVYRLNTPGKETNAVPESGSPVDLKAISRDFLQTVAALPETETEDLNS